MTNTTTQRRASCAACGKHDVVLFEAEQHEQHEPTEPVHGPIRRLIAEFRLQDPFENKYRLVTTTVIGSGLIDHSLQSEGGMPYAASNMQNKHPLPFTDPGTDRGVINLTEAVIKSGLYTIESTQVPVLRLPWRADRKKAAPSRHPRPDQTLSKEATRRDAMTRDEYIGHLRALYLAANSSDTEVAPDWMVGTECATHCQPYDAVAREMRLPTDWLDRPLGESK